MKINFNKKLLAGSLALTMATTSLASCHSYKSDSDGSVYLEGKISYDDISDYKLIELKTLNGNKLYITKYDTATFSSKDHYYYDVFTDLCVYTNTDTDTCNELIREYKLGDFLVSLDKLKSEYSADDLKSILNDINEVYGFEDNNELAIKK